MEAFSRYMNGTNERDLKAVALIYLYIICRSFYVIFIFIKHSVLLMFLKDEGRLYDIKVKVMSLKFHSTLQLFISIKTIKLRN